MPPGDFIFIDTETTSLDVTTAEIIEIFCLDFVDYRPTGKAYYGLFKPGSDIPADANNTHKITNEHVSEAPSFGQHAEQLRTFLRDLSPGEKLKPLAFHNAPYDLPVLNRNFLAHGEEALRSEDYVREIIADRDGNKARRISGRYRHLESLEALGHFRISTIDTMRDATLTGKVRHKVGRYKGKVKWASLAEACILWGIDAPEKMHRAPTDVKFGSKCYLASQKIPLDDPRMTLIDEVCAPFIRNADSSSKNYVLMSLAGLPQGNADRSTVPTIPEKDLKAMRALLKRHADNMPAPALPPPRKRLRDTFIREDGSRSR